MAAKIVGFIAAALMLVLLLAFPDHGRIRPPVVDLPRLLEGESETYPSRYAVARSSSANHVVLLHGDDVTGIEAVASAVRAQGRAVNVLDGGRPGQVSVFIDRSEDLGPFSQADLDRGAVLDEVIGYYDGGPGDVDFGAALRRSLGGG